MKKFELNDLLIDYIHNALHVIKEESAEGITVFFNKDNYKSSRIRIFRRGKNGIQISIGKPNFRERRYVKSCKKNSAPLDPIAWL